MPTGIMRVYTLLIVIKISLALFLNYVNLLSEVSKTTKVNKVSLFIII